MPKAAELDAKVAGMLKTVKEKRCALKELSKPQWATSCRLELPGFDAINIQVATDLSLLAVALGTLHRMENDIAEANTNLDLGLEFVWRNYRITQWCEDIRLRIKVTQLQAEKQKLAALEKKLKPLLSDDQRRELALAEIEEQL